MGLSLSVVLCLGSDAEPEPRTLQYAFVCYSTTHAYDGSGWEADSPAGSPEQHKHDPDCGLERTFGGQHGQCSHRECVTLEFANGDRLAYGCKPKSQANCEMWKSLKTHGLDGSAVVGCSWCNTSKCNTCSGPNVNSALPPAALSMACAVCLSILIMALVVC